MFERFERQFKRDAIDPMFHDLGQLRKNREVALDELFRRFGGASFGGGLYRLVVAETQGWADEFAGCAFPGYSGRVVCFAYDWLGRIFAVDSVRSENGHQGVVMFEPGTGEDLEIPCDVVNFHDGELIDFADAAVASDFHAEWLSNGGAKPRLNQCIGYRKPLFLGGVDEIENLELSDLDVYWSVGAQLIRKARGLPPSAPVGQTGPEK